MRSGLGGPDIIGPVGSRKRADPGSEEAPSSVPRLYGEEGDDGGGTHDGWLKMTARPPSPTAPSLERHPPPSRDALPTNPMDTIPETVRALDDVDQPPVARLSSEIPDLAPDDGTHTDKTAIMLDRSVRQGERPTLTILTGMRAGSVFSVEKVPLTIGRAKTSDVRLDDAGVSRNHARLVRAATGEHFVEDAGSTNGVRVNGVRTQRSELRAGDRVQLGPEVVLQFAFLDDTEENLTKQLYAAATRDGLTSALNRGAFDERLTSEISYARRHQAPLSLVMFDVDHFKRVNDTYGHICGDAVLREVAKLVQRTIRTEDVFGRYGGEEFAVVVRGQTFEQAVLLAERLRVAVATLPIVCQAGTISVTISLGVASMAECKGAAVGTELVAAADRRLYAAKQAGRNRVGVK